MMDVKGVLFQWSIEFLINKLLAAVLIMSDQQLAEELHKQIVRKFDKRKVRSPIIDNIWGADLADMQLISKFNKGICFSLCDIDIFSKYA